MSDELFAYYASRQVFSLAADIYSNYRGD